MEARKGKRAGGRKENNENAARGMNSRQYNSPNNTLASGRRRHRRWKPYQSPDSRECQMESTRHASKKSHSVEHGYATRYKSTRATHFELYKRTYSSLTPQTLDSSFTDLLLNYSYNWFNIWVMRRPPALISRIPK